MKFFRENQQNVKVTENNIEVNGLNWFYREVVPQNEVGEKAVLLLHGLPSQSLSWCDLMPELGGNGFRAIAPDWMGFGFSAKPEKGEFAYTPKAYLQGLEALIEALELEQFHLIVQGFLGSVGLQYALQNPDRIDRLVILNTPLSPKDKLPWKLSQVKIPFVGDMLTQDPLLAERILEGGTGYEIAEGNLAIYRKPYLKSSAAGRAFMTVVKRLQLPKTITDIQTGLQQWEKPTQIIWGMADPWLDYTPVRTLAEASNVELVELEEAKHYPQEHWSKEIAPSVINFFRRQAV